MGRETLVHKCRLQVLGKEYEVYVYLREDGRHLAMTFFTPEDVIVHDGPSLDEALAKHRRLLPLAIDSRQLLRSYRPGSEHHDH